MTLTQAERDELFGVFEQAAARTGGIVSRALFETVCDFAAAGDVDAQRMLARIYQIATRELLADGKEQSHEDTTHRQ